MKMTMKNNLSVAIASACMSVGTGLNAKNYINSNGELMLYGVIGDWWDGNDALSVVSQLEHAKPHGDLHVRIHSEGGNYLDGLAIYNALKQSDRRIVVTIDGMALSMATIIALAGDEIRMPRNAFQFLHLALSEVAGNSNDLRAAAETLEQFSNQAASIYAAHSNLSEQEALALMEKETWLNAEQCLEHGLIHTILDPVEAVAHHMDFGDRELPKGVAAMLQLPVTAAPAAQNEDDEDGEPPVKPAQMNAGPAKPKPNLQETQPAPNAGPEAATMQAEGARLERLRQSELRVMAKNHNISATVLQKLIDDGTEVSEAREIIMAELAKRDTAEMPSGRGAMVTKDNQADMRSAISEALLHRAAPGANKIEGPNEYAHMSMIDISRTVLQQNGVSVGGMSPNQIAAAVLQSTSDLPAVFADVANNELARGYAQRARSYQSIARRTNMNNFKTKQLTRLSDAPNLAEKGENGEYQLGQLEDSKESITLSTKGRIIRISREMLINDDLDALSRLPMMMGAQGALTENRAVFSLLGNNPKMGEDNKALFHADHKNLLTGAADLDVALLGLLRKALRTQKTKGAKGEEGYALNTPLGALVVPAALETDAQKIISAIVASKVSDVNPFSNLQVIAEAELDAFSESAVYGVGDPDLVGGLIYGYLEGEEGVYVDSAIDFKSDALDLKVRHDFAASVEDYRGLVKHTRA